MSAVRVSRDWRGIKYRLNEFSTDEVIHLRDTARETSQQISRFIINIDTELALRQSSDTGSPPGLA